MRQAAGGMKDPIVVINADATASHQAVIHVMEAARLAGLSHVSFATQTQPK
jgi:biopolymer transport protein ExbD